MKASGAPRRSREERGALYSAAIAACNLLLSALKFLAGWLSGSVAIAADAANNLADSLSGLVSLAGFRIAAKKADARHPFGHGRAEYIAGLAVSFLVLLAGAELLRASAAAALHPSRIEAGLFPAALAALSVAIKCAIGLCAKRAGRKIASAALEAAAADSLADALSSLAALLSLLLARAFPESGIPFDGIAGILIACLILRNGVASLKKTVEPLIGAPASLEVAERIRAIVLSHEPISGIHDLVVHDYGPGNVMITLHAEMPGGGSVAEAHKVIDAAESDIMLQTGWQAVIHADPVDLESEEFIRAREALHEIIKGIDPDLSFHDLQLVPENKGAILAFDLVRPRGGKRMADGDAALRKAIGEKAKAALGEGYRCAIRIEEAFS